MSDEGNDFSSPSRYRPVLPHDLFNLFVGRLVASTRTLPRAHFVLP